MNSIDRVQLYNAVGRLAEAHHRLGVLAERDGRFIGMRDRAHALWDEAETELRAIEEAGAAEKTQLDAEDALDTRGKEAS